MTRRALVVIALLASCALTMGAGWLSGPRFGSGVGPGFAPVGRVSVGADSSGINSALFRNGLILELLPGNWHLNGSTIDIWYDSSGQGRNATQTTAINQPGVLNGVASFSGGQSLNAPKRDATFTIVRCMIATSAWNFGANRIDVHANVMSTVTEEDRIVFGLFVGDTYGDQFEWAFPKLAYNPGVFSAGISPGVEMTLGAYTSSSENKSYFYSSTNGAFQVYSTALSGSTSFNKFGTYWNNSSPWKGTITAVWQWNIDPGLTDFAAIASIAAAYDPARGY